MKIIKIVFLINKIVINRFKLRNHSLTTHTLILIHSLTPFSGPKRDLRRRWALILSVQHRDGGEVDAVRLQPGDGSAQYVGAKHHRLAIELAAAGDQRATSMLRLCRKRARKRARDEVTTDVPSFTHQILLLLLLLAVGGTFSVQRGVLVVPVSDLQKIV